MHFQEVGTVPRRRVGAVTSACTVSGSHVGAAPATCPLRDLSVDGFSVAAILLRVARVLFMSQGPAPCLSPGM